MSDKEVRRAMEDFSRRMMQDILQNSPDFARGGFIENPRRNGRAFRNPFNEITWDNGREEKPEKNIAGRKELEEAKAVIEQQNEILQRINKEALILQTVTKISKDGKYTFIKKGDIELRAIAPEGLKVGHEVLLHPKTMQIVENMGFPPLEISPFAPAEIPNVVWDDIGGLEDAKREMIEAIELPVKEKELYKFYGKKQVKGILLSGSPGCGKTLLGKAAARSLANLHGAAAARSGFLYIKGPEILNRYVGASEETVRQLFSDARRHYMEFKYPAIIFVDEADAILAKRGGFGFNVGNTIVPAFLTEMDGLQESTAIVILATNRPEVLDPAIIREGRIDRKIVIERPDLLAAQKILELNLKHTALSKGFTLKAAAECMAEEFFINTLKMADDTEFRQVVNGAMLATAVDLAITFAMRRDMQNKAQTGITKEDCKKAVLHIYTQNKDLTHNL